MDSPYIIKYYDSFIRMLPAHALPTAPRLPPHPPVAL